MALQKGADVNAFPFSDLDKKVYFVAEIGSNHNKDIKRLTALIESAKQAGFDAIKLQYYKADMLWSNEFPERIKQAKNGELPDGFLKEANLISYNNGIAIGCSVFHKDHVSIVHPHVDFLKVSSYECLNFDLIQECKKAQLPLFISTGMCTRAEIYSVATMIQAKEYKNAIFHCVSEYPAKEASIEIVEAIAPSFSHWLDIGYSDHTKSIGVVIAAIHAGAKIVEIHLDLNDMQGTESHYGHCWSKDEAAQLISIVGEMTKATKKIDWIDNFSSRSDRNNISLRCDLSDGRRPQKSARGKQNGE